DSKADLQFGACLKFIREPPFGGEPDFIVNNMHSFSRFYQTEKISDFAKIIKIEIVKVLDQPGGHPAFQQQSCHLLCLFVLFRQYASTSHQIRRQNIVHQRGNQIASAVPVYFYPPVVGLSGNDLSLLHPPSKRSYKCVGEFDKIILTPVIFNQLILGGALLSNQLQ